MKMKTFCLVLALCITCVFAVPVLAEDVILNANVSKVVTDKLDKNGAPFTVIVIQEERTLSGVAYTADAPIFATGPATEEALKVKAGDTMKAVVSKRVFHGDTVYSLRKVIP
jgi:hypothetical protein